ncbi:MAG: YfhO family protein, partial [Chthoniobacterales bacterium]
GTIGKRLARPCVIVAVAVTLFPLLYFLPATSGSLIISPDDGIIQNIPFRVAVANMIRDGYAPLWNPYLFCGMPLFAAAQTGVLFPLNWFYLLFPPATATNLMMLSTYMVAGLGGYLYARRSGASVPGAAVTSLVWQCGGFMVNQIGHTNIAQTAALLPWLFWALDGYARDGDGRRGLLLGAIVALQCFAGHQQTFVYGLILAVAYAVVMWRAARAAGSRTFYLSSILFLAAGLALAAVQIIPTLELLRESLRADASYDFFTSFSMPRNFIWTFFAPYVAGGGDGLFFRAPYVGPSFYAEYVGYVGLTTLGLAFLALLVRRDPSTVFWGSVAVIGVVLALGRYAPFGIYKLVYAVPVLNLFRVPARHLMEFEFGLAILAGKATTALFEEPNRAAMKRRALVAGGAIVLITFFAITVGRPADFRLARTAPVTILRSPELFLPPVIAALAAWAIWRTARRPGRASAGFLIGVLLFDLILWGQFSGWRVSSPSPRSGLWSEPPAFKFLREQQEQGTERFRILTQDHFFSAAQTVSYSNPGENWTLELQPDIAMMHRRENAAGYEGFGLARYSKLAGDMKVWGDLTDPERTLRADSRELDLLNVRYLLVRAEPDGPRHKEAPLIEVNDGEVFGGETFARGNLNLPPIVSGERLSFKIAPMEVDRIGLLTALAWAENAPDDVAVAQVRLRGNNGETVDLELRAGQHSSEWAHDRADLHGRIRHRRAPVATSYPVTDRDSKFDGHDYIASFPLAKPMTVTGGEIVVHSIAEATRLMLTLNRLSLRKNDRVFTVAREHINKEASHPAMVEGVSARWNKVGIAGSVAIFENSRALPRVVLVGTDRVASGDEQLDIIRSGKMPDGSLWNASECALVESGTGLEKAEAKSGQAEIARYEPNRVEIKTESSGRSLLVLADNYFPGWRAKIDGHRAKVLRANYNQRAVTVPAGSHIVSFSYQPKSVLCGLIISVVTLVALIWWARKSRAHVAGGVP